MKIEIPFNWDRLIQGELPKSRLLEIDPKMVISKEKVTTFKDKVTITIEIPEEDNPLQVAFELGSLIAIINSKGA